MATEGLSQDAFNGMVVTSPAAFVTGSIYHWWVGVLLLVVVTPALFRGTKTRMMRGVIYRAVEDPTVFDFCVKHDVFRFRAPPNQ
jgi:hypothetical protein